MKMPITFDQINKDCNDIARQMLEKKLLSIPQVPCPVMHRFGPGIYIREVTIPAGTFAIGHKQNFEHLNIFLKGRVTILNDDSSTSELTAPMMFTGKPGRKIGYVHEDMTWLNVYATNETDVEKLEERYLTKSQDFKEAAEIRFKAQVVQSKIDRDDFGQALKEMGVTRESVRAQSVNESDLSMEMLDGYKVRLAKSSIEGRGLFATADLESGEVIYPARVGMFRTIAGRFTNHSKNPNAKMVRSLGRDIDLIATRNIMGCHGGMDGEEITIDYRDAYKLNVEIARGD